MKRTFYVIHSFLFALGSIRGYRIDAQAASGDIAGPVRDAAGGLLPSAAATLKARPTGMTASVTTAARSAGRAFSLSFSLSP